MALLQETHLDDREHQKLKREWVGQIFSASYKNRKKRGVAILCHKSIGLIPDKIHADKEGRYVMVVGVIGGINLTIMNLYAPNADNPTFFKEIASLIAEHSKGIIIVGGDFNCVINQRMDKCPFELRAQTSKSKSLCSMMVELGLVDIWRLKHPKEKDYTHFSGVHKSYSRIDFFCISNQDAYKVAGCHIEPTTISDHGPVILSLRLSPEKPAKFWRLNVSLLNNPKIVQDIKDELKNFLEHNDNDEVSASTLWDAAKAVLRGKIIALSSKLKKERERLQSDWEESIKNLEQQHKQTKDDSILKSLSQNKQRLNDLLTHKAEGALRFSNQKFYELGNQASRLLAFQLRKAQASRVVHKIVCPSSKKQMSHPKDISEAFATYYKKLYDSSEEENKEEIIRNFLGPPKLTKLDENDAKLMAEPITENEIKEVIKNLKNNKSPGTDGYPGEFYKCLQAEITPLLQRVFNYALNKKDPPKTWS